MKRLYFLLLAPFAAYGCAEPNCRPGELKVADTCYPLRDAAVHVRDGTFEEQEWPAATANPPDRTARDANVPLGPDAVAPRPIDPVQTPALLDASREAMRWPEPADATSDDAGSSDAHVSSGSCTPSAEACDGKDNDCDNEVDEGACGPLRHVVQLAAGARHTCARLLSGKVACWGDNASGQLGDGTVERRVRPVLVRNIGDAREIAAGAQHTCALRVANSVVCWGDNSEGQVGDGSRINRLVPADVVNLTDVLTIGAGAMHSCAIGSSGRTQCWGSNRQAQISGDGTPVFENVSPALGVSNTLPAEIVGGTSHTCARTNGLGASCWGRGIQRTAAGPSPLSHSITTIIAGDGHVCGLSQETGLECYGANAFGQLGDGTTMDSFESVVRVDLLDIVAISAGAHFTCGVHASGKISCWGANVAGQLGDGTNRDHRSPALVASISDAINVEAGSAHACSVGGEGRVSCWGDNQHGQLGDGTTESKVAAVPVKTSLTIAPD